MKKLILCIGLLTLFGCTSNIEVRFEEEISYFNSDFIRHFPKKK